MQECYNRETEEGATMVGTTGVAGIFCLRFSCYISFSAARVGGMTLHAWAGIGLGQGTVAELITAMAPQAIQRWKTTTKLYCEELGVIKDSLYDKLVEIGQRLRNNTLPWGGIQVSIFNNSQTEFNRTMCVIFLCDLIFLACDKQSVFPSYLY